MIIIDRESAIPLYKQIYQQILASIESGDIAPFCILEGIRSMSKILGVSINTVERAYSQLATEGYIESRKGVGFVVQKIFIDNTTPKQNYYFSSNSQNGNSISPIQVKQPKYDLTQSNISIDSFPKTLWKRYLSEALEYREISNYQEERGYFQLRHQLSKYLKENRGVNCFEEQIIITAGHQHSLDILCSLLLTAGDSVAMEDPGFSRTMWSFRKHNLRIHPVPLDNQGLEVSYLSKLKNIKIVYVTPSHQFPTGVVMTVGRRYELLNWANKENAYIIEDDYDSEYSYYSNPVPSMHSIDMNDRTIYLGTFSKTLSPALGIGYFVIPKHLVCRYNKYSQSGHSLVSWIDQYIISKLIEDGHYKRIIRRLCTVYKKKHHLLMEGLRNLQHNIKICNPGTGMTFFLQLNSSMDSDKYISNALLHGVKIGSAKPHWFSDSDKANHVLLLGFSSIAIEDIHDLLERLKNAWD